MFVLRDAEAGVPALVAANVAPHVSVLSAGEAHLSHPTQGLLDALTVLQHKGRFDGLSIAIVGDIRHSRVARSACACSADCSARATCGSWRRPALMPDGAANSRAARASTAIDRGIAGCDVVMMLRIQKERFAEAAIPDGRRLLRANSG